VNPKTKKTLHAVAAERSDMNGTHARDIVAKTAMRARTMMMS
jgi:hypothetical protein